MTRKPWMPKPYPGLLVCHTRTGGTFLSHCLDSHPQVFCARVEVLHQGSVIGRTFPMHDPVDYLKPYLLEYGYRAAFVKVVQGRERQRRELLPFIADSGGRVIHLTRRNVLNAAASNMLRYLGLATFTTGESERFTAHLDTVKLVEEMRWRLDLTADFRQRVRAAGVPVLDLEYTGLVGHEGADVDRVLPDAAAAICDFLEVRRCSLVTELRQCNRWPLRETVENWDEVEEAVREAGFGWCIDEKDPSPTD